MFVAHAQRSFSQSTRTDDDTYEQACTPLAIRAAIERNEDVPRESRRGFRTCFGLASDNSEGKDTRLTLIKMFV